MESNDSRSNKLSSYTSRKRRSSRESNSSLDRHGIRTETADEGLDTLQLLHRLESKNRELETRINNMYTEFKTMRSENQDLKSRINKLERRSHDTTPMNQDLNTFLTQQIKRKPMESNDARSNKLSSYPSRKRRSSRESNSSLDRHEIRAETVDEGVDTLQLLHRLEAKNRELETHINNMYTEFKTMRSENQDLKSQVQNLQQQYDRLISQNRQFQSRINKFEHRSHDSTSMNQDVPPENYDFEQHCREIQAGNTNVDQLVKDFDIRFGLHTLSLKVNPTTSQMEFDCLTQIHSIRAYSLKQEKTDQKNQTLELLRVITTSPNLPDYLFLNRGYRRLESVNTNTWKVMRGWSKQDLDYGNQDTIGLITCSYDGSYLAMKIKWNERLRLH
ncbi:unnamed protein product [Adineta steineri]|uniref:Uncharacterized protein n=1 Tax=Adineta steineri TaxID=433720 RepID=A0A814BIS4_9BILA|nr:unnamed protein product [Adineta steineri]